MMYAQRVRGWRRDERDESEILLRAAPAIGLVILEREKAVALIHSTSS